MNNHDELLSLLGERLGIELYFEEKQCFIMLDQALMISIRQQDQGWVLYGMLKKVPANQDGAFWREFMMHNLVLAEGGAGAIGYDAQSEALVYIDTLPLSQFYIDSAYDFIDLFVERMEYLLEIIGDYKK